MYPVNAVVSNFSKFHLRLGLPGSIFASRLPIQSLCAFLTAAMHCACPLALVFGNAKAKVALVRFVKTYWSRGIAPPILNLGTNEGKWLNLMVQALYQPGKNPGTHCMRD